MTKSTHKDGPFGNKRFVFLLFVRNLQQVVVADSESLLEAIDKVAENSDDEFDRVELAMSHSYPSWGPKTLFFLGQKALPEKSGHTAKYVFLRFLFNILSTKYGLYTAKYGQLWQMTEKTTFRVKTCQICLLTEKKWRFGAPGLHPIPTFLSWYHVDPPLKKGSVFTLEDGSVFPKSTLKKAGYLEV